MKKNVKFKKKIKNQLMIHQPHKIIAKFQSLKKWKNKKIVKLKKIN